MQFGSRFKIFLFSTSVLFSTKTLAYLSYKAYKPYKAFMAFKAYKAYMDFTRLLLDPFQYDLSCDPALSVHDNVNHHQDNTRDQHVNAFTLIGSQFVVMVLRAQ